MPFTVINQSLPGEDFSKFVKYKITEKYLTVYMIVNVIQPG